METKPFTGAPPRCEATHPDFTAVRCVKEATKLHAEHRGYLPNESGAREPVSWPNDDHQEMLVQFDEILSGSARSVLGVRTATLDDVEALVAVVVEAEADESTSSDRQPNLAVITRFVEECLREGVTP